MGVSICRSPRPSTVVGADLRRLPGRDGTVYALALALTPWRAQMCGGFPDALARCAQLIEEHAAVDFVDINMGCPIDIICNRCGSAERQGWR